jgi:hypothetical protein
VGDRIGIEPVLGLVGILSLIAGLTAWFAFARAHAQSE